MTEELMITKEDLVNWLDRQPSNDDLDLIDFITNRLGNFYKLEQENKQLKDKIENIKDFNNKLQASKDRLDKDDYNLAHILTELEEWLKEQGNNGIDEWGNHYTICLYKLNKLKEKYK